MPTLGERIIELSSLESGTLREHLYNIEGDGFVLVSEIEVEVVNDCIDVEIIDDIIDVEVLAFDVEVEVVDDTIEVEVDYCGT